LYETVDKIYEKYGSFYKIRQNSTKIIEIQPVNSLEYRGIELYDVVNSLRVKGEDYMLEKIKRQIRWAAVAAGASATHRGQPFKLEDKVFRPNAEIQFAELKNEGIDLTGKKFYAKAEGEGAASTAPKFMYHEKLGCWVEVKWDEDKVVVQSSTHSQVPPAEPCVFSDSMDAADRALLYGLNGRPLKDAAKKGDWVPAARLWNDEWTTDFGTLDWIPAAALVPNVSIALFDGSDPGTWTPLSGRATLDEYSVEFPRGTQGTDDRWFIKRPGKAPALFDKSGRPDHLFRIKPITAGVDWPITGGVRIADYDPTSAMYTFTNGSKTKASGELKSGAPAVPLAGNQPRRVYLTRSEREGGTDVWLLDENGQWRRHRPAEANWTAQAEPEWAKELETDDFTARAFEHARAVRKERAAAAAHQQNQAPPDQPPAAGAPGQPPGQQPQGAPGATQQQQHGANGQGAPGAEPDWEAAIRQFSGTKDTEQERHAAAQISDKLHTLLGAGLGKPKPDADIDRKSTYGTYAARLHGAGAAAIVGLTVALGGTIVAALGPVIAAGALAGLVGPIFIGLAAAGIVTTIVSSIFAAVAHSSKMKCRDSTDFVQLTENDQKETLKKRVPDMTNALVNLGVDKQDAEALGKSVGRAVDLGTFTRGKAPALPIDGIFQDIQSVRALNSLLGLCGGVPEGTGFLQSLQGRVATSLMGGTKDQKVDLASLQDGLVTVQPLSKCLAKQGINFGLRTAASMFSSHYDRGTRQWIPWSLQEVQTVLQLMNNGHGGVRIPREFAEPVRSMLIGCYAGPDKKGLSSAQRKAMQAIYSRACNELARKPDGKPCETELSVAAKAWQKTRTPIPVSGPSAVGFDSATANPKTGMALATGTRA
jgi:hypothetical protein